MLETNEARERFCSVVAEAGDEPEDLEVHPHDGHEDTESAGPRVFRRNAALHADLRLIEILDEAAYTDEDRDQTDDNAKRDAGTLSMVFM